MNAQEAVQQPVVQWYDARARVALRRVALWLHVPAAKLAMFEAMLAQTAQVPASILPSAMYRNSTFWLVDLCSACRKNASIRCEVAKIRRACRRATPPDMLTPSTRS